MMPLLPPMIYQTAEKTSPQKRNSESLTFVNTLFRPIVFYRLRGGMRTVSSAIDFVSSFDYTPNYPDAPPPFSVCGCALAEWRLFCTPLVSLVGYK